LPDAVWAVILDLYASFSVATNLILTLECAASYSLASVGHRVFPGSVVAMFHHSMVTCSVELLELPESSPPQALRSGTDRPASPAAERKVRRERGSGAHQGPPGLGVGQCR
jgi:hypothetical protein